jgi:hypothetical protein
MAASEADQHALDGYLKSLIEFAVNGGVLKGMSPEAQRAADAATASAPPSEHEFAEAGTTGDGLASEAEEEQQEEEEEEKKDGTREERRARKTAKKEKKAAKKAPPATPPTEEDDDNDSMVTAVDDLPQASMNIGDVLEQAAEVAAAKQRTHGPTRRQKDLEEAILREQEHAEEATDEADNAAQAEIDRVVSGIKAQLLDAPKKAKMVAFLDLEWHTLDKKAPSEMVVGQEMSLLTAHICQICAISADYSIVFNQYISYRKLKEPWCRLVRDNVMEFSPQDDPQVALPVETVMEQFVAAFPEDTLFLSYGTTDAASIFKTLTANADYDLYNEKVALPEDKKDKRAAILKLMIDKQWRFGNIIHWIKEQDTELDLGFKLGGSLGQLYDILFHYSLWMSYPTLSTPSKIVTPDAALLVLDEELVAEFPSSDPEKFGLVPREWLLVPNNRNLSPDAHRNCFPQFWPTKHLEPVFHVAHTDTVMTINCVAALFMAQNKLVTDVTELLVDTAVGIDKQKEEAEFRTIFKIPLVPKTAKERKYDEKLTTDWAKIESKQEESAYNSLATSVIAKTWFFRKFQLALSATAEADLYKFYERDDLEGDGKKKTKFNRSRTAGEMKRHAYVTACHTAGFRPNKAGDDEIELHDGLYEVDAVVRWEWDKKMGPGYWIRWKGSADEEDRWLKLADLGGCTDLIQVYMKGRTKPKATDFALIKKNKWDVPPVNTPPPPAPPKSKAPPAASNSGVDRELAEALTYDEREEAEAEEFENNGKDKAHYFSLLQQHPTIQNRQFHQLVMAKRGGKFTDKVKAIRSFLIKEALESNDDLLLNTLVQSEHPFAEKRKLKFPKDPVKNYSGLPWFSLKTSVAEPRTEMLHTLMCRNLSDPDSEERKTRNFAELDVTLWEFDLIVKARIFLNTRFRFCKECKEYTNIKNLLESEDQEVNELVAKFRAASVAPPPPPARRLSPPRQPSVAAPSSAASVNSGSTNSRRSRFTVETLTRPLNYQTPLTPLVSYFALRSSSII